MFGRMRKLEDFTAEIEAHLQLEIDRLREQGLSEDDARAAARRAFGNVLQAEERFYEQQRWNWWDHLRQDVRYGLRMLSRAPGFTAISILTIALGIGATTALFSVIDATLLRPLPYWQPEQLVKIEDDLPGVGSRNVGMSVPEWQDFQRSGIFAHVAPIGGGDVNLTGSTHPERVPFLVVTPDYFALLGVSPQFGFSFNTEDRTPGFTLEALISDGLWKRAFGADPKIVGRTLRLDNDAYRVVGVMPEGFHDPGRTAEERNTEIWLSAGFTAAPFPAPLRTRRLVQAAIARIAPGLTIDVAQRRLDATVAALQQQFPDAYPPQSGWTVRLVPLKESVVGNIRTSLLLLFGAVGLVLLISCVNVANLLLARASARSREMAVRQALGAARPRLVTQLLTESVVLSLIGGVVGLVLLFFARASLMPLLPDSLPRLNEIAIRWPVFLFALTGSLLAGAAFGLAPALHAGRPDLAHTLSQETRGSTASADRSRRWLVVTEIALSLVLTVSAGLLLRSFIDLLNLPLGFAPEKVMAVRTWLPVPNDPATDIYRTVQQEAPFLREVLRRARTLPRVEGAAIGDVASVPLGHSWRDLNPVPLSLEDHDQRATEAPLVNVSKVTPEYFHLLSMSLLRGRVFTDADIDTAPPVAVVNQSFATTYWLDDAPLGRRIRLQIPGDSSTLNWITVVGVIDDARTESLAEATPPQVYLSLYQRRAKDLAIFVRGPVDTAALPIALRAEVQSVNAELPVFGARQLDTLVSASLSERRFAMQVLALFALTTLFLAGLGVYGVISYLVSARTDEIRIRRALGAQSRDILSLVLRQGLGLAIAGTAAGILCAAVVSHLMAEQLYGVRPTDPLTFGSVALLLIAISLLACYSPARRALRVDSLISLRRD